jgi:alanine dehydrogenase
MTATLDDVTKRRQADESDEPRSARGRMRQTHRSSVLDQSLLTVLKTASRWHVERGSDGDHANSPMDLRQRIGPCYRVVGHDGRMPQTLMLTRSDLRRCVDVTKLASELRDAFGGYQETDDAQRVRVPVDAQLTAMVLVPGMAGGIPAYTVKVHAKNPARHPALLGVICLHDLHTGDLLALLDSGWITSVRTGVGAALGTQVLARLGGNAVGVIGAGAQGRSQLTALAALRPIESVAVFDIDPHMSSVFSEQMSDVVGTPVRVARDVKDVACSSDILLVATWSRTPVLDRDDVSAGAHITSLGADEPGKVELSPQLLSEALVVTDDQRLASPVLRDVSTSLSRVLRGEHPGRRCDDEVTVYSPVGLPLQDCVAAWHAYQRAADLGLGTQIDLED